MARARGRPTNLTPQLTKRICATIRQGNYREVAAGAAGVPVRTFHRWCQRGRDEERGQYADFWQAVLKAERDAEIRAVGLIAKASAKDPKHAEWWLERKYPKRWGRKDTVEVVLEKLARRVGGMSDEQLLAILAGGSPEAGGRGGAVPGPDGRRNGTAGPR